MATPETSVPHFELQFKKSGIAAIAERYCYPGDERIVDEVGPVVRERGHFLRDEFVEICSWKTKRSRSQIAQNGEEIVEATRLALHANSERLRTVGASLVAC